MSAQDSAMYIYYGTYLSNEGSQMVGNISFGEATLGEIWNSVSETIDGIQRLHTSEAMVSCMYLAIADMRKRLFDGENPMATIGSSSQIRSLSFILLTDESIFTPDTLDGVNSLYTRDTNKHYDKWFADWHSLATNKFPVTTTWTTSGISSQDKIRYKTNFVQDISKALKQMSYYYGVNFTFTLYAGLAASGDPAIILNNGGILLNTCTVYKHGDNWEVDYHNDEVFTVSSDYHVDNPHEPMISIVLTIPEDYISAPDTPALGADKTMTYRDQFIQDNLLFKFHKESNTKYCAFRFFRRNIYSGELYEDEAIGLPNTAQMNLSEGTYKWVIDSSGREFNPGDTYTIRMDDLSAYTDGHYIRFRLNKMDTTLDSDEQS